MNGREVKRNCLAPWSPSPPVYIFDVGANGIFQHTIIGFADKILLNSLGQIVWTMLPPKNMGTSDLVILFHLFRV